MLGMPPPWMIYVALAACALSGAGGYHFRDLQAKAAQAKALEAAAKEKDRIQSELDRASAQYEEARRIADVALQGRTSTIERIFRDAPALPADCLPPPAVRGVLVDAVEAANAQSTGQLGDTVPASPASTGTVR